jgi:hypothetical protein
MIDWSTLDCFFNEHNSKKEMNFQRTEFEISTKIPIETTGKHL